MKKLVEVMEVEGLEALLGEQVLLFGLNYLYTGKLVGVNSLFVKLENPKIVYETGPFSDKGYKDVRNFPAPFWYVQLLGVESYGLGR